MRICRKTQVSAKSCERFGFLLVRFTSANITFQISSCVLLVQTSLFKFHRSVVRDLCGTDFWRRVDWVRLPFCSSNFWARTVWTSNLQLITDVYNHRFWCRFNEQRFFLNNWGVCSETSTVFYQVVRLLNIFTMNVSSVRKPEKRFWYELATMTS